MGLHNVKYAKKGMLLMISIKDVSVMAYVYSIKVKMYVLNVANIILWLMESVMLPIVILFNAYHILHVSNANKDILCHLMAHAFY